MSCSVVSGKMVYGAKGMESGRSDLPRGTESWGNATVREVSSTVIESTDLPVRYTTVPEGLADITANAKIVSNINETLFFKTPKDRNGLQSYEIIARVPSVRLIFLTF